MIFIASGGAAPLLTDGRISGGGFITFSMISAYRKVYINFYGETCTVGTKDFHFVSYLPGTKRACKMVLRGLPLPA